MHSEEIQEAPLLYFLLEFRKYAEMIKIMINRSLSQSVLKEYGSQGPTFSEHEQRKINRSISHFTINQLIEINGSSHHRTKHYENRLLIQTIQRKIHSEPIDHSTRKNLWVQFTDIYAKRALYNSLRLMEIPHDFVQIIDKDLKRTRTEPEIKSKAREVLISFVQFNPYIGYCQGMNSIIVFFLQENFNCEETFFIFKRLTEIILPCDYYSQMNGIVGYMKIFFQLLQHTHPSIYQKLKKIIKQMDNSFMVVMTGVFQWFVCLFTNVRFKRNLTRIIMNHLLIEGITVLFKASLAIFDHLEEHILKTNSFEQFVEVEKHIQHITDETQLKKRLKETYLSEHILQLLKEKYLQTVQPPIPHSKKERLKKQERKCNHQWNACLQTIQQNIEKEHTYDFFVYKTADQVSLQHRYLEKLNKQYFVQNKSSGNAIDQLLIGRMEHTCRRSQTITQGSISDKIQKNQPELLTPSKCHLSSSLESKRTELNEDSERKIREKIQEELNEQLKDSMGLAHSESITFMKDMIKNASIHNLLEFYDIDEMFE